MVMSTCVDWNKVISHGRIGRTVGSIMLRAVVLKTAECLGGGKREEGIAARTHRVSGSVGLVGDMQADHVDQRQRSAARWGQNATCSARG
jgi:hypothetical protein